MLKLSLVQIESLCKCGMCDTSYKQGITGQPFVSFSLFSIPLLLFAYHCFLDIISLHTYLFAILCLRIHITLLYSFLSHSPGFLWHVITMIPDNIPYTMTLSLLRKIDLMRLSLEFRLLTDGSVVVLRNRLKTYPNAHQDILYHNPCYNVLFPKLRRLNPPPNSPQLSFYAPSNRSHSPSLTPSHSSHSL